METIKTIELNKLRDEAYQNAVEHGWHDENLSTEHFLCLIISELMEAVQAERKGKRADVAKFKEWQNNISFSEETRLKRFQEDFEAYIKDSVEDECADACIRIFGVSHPYSLSIHELRKLTFTEWCFDITAVITRYDHLFGFAMDAVFIKIIDEMYFMSKIKGFDLLWHIELKMKYNRTRPRMHGNNKF